MKNLLLIGCLALSLASCNVFKRTTATRPATNVPPSTKAEKTSPVFIENISIHNEQTGGKGVQSGGTAIARDMSVEPVNAAEIMYILQFKYAILLDAPVEEMLDHKLIEFLENWYGTPYRLGGTDKNGVDCSAFVQSFMSAMYAVIVPRTSREQYAQRERISKDELVEGDLVFFRTQRKKGVSHVGVYLRNNKFVHASTSSGVMISDLREDYFSSRYVGSGRYKNIDNHGN